ncbi:MULTISPECIES: hypothetical protein [Acetobacter]|nr:MULTISPECIES: hypothetical protein [Acetobacter]
MTSSLCPKIHDGSSPPADVAWDDFFAAPGVDLGERNQPAMQEREAL